jgi:hypothetical protein
VLNYPQTTRDLNLVAPFERSRYLLLHLRDEHYFSYCRAERALWSQRASASGGGLINSDVETKPYNVSCEARRFQNNTLPYCGGCLVPSGARSSTPIERGFVNTTGQFPMLISIIAFSCHPLNNSHALNPQFSTFRQFNFRILRHRNQPSALTTATPSRHSHNSHTLAMSTVVFLNKLPANAESSYVATLFSPDMLEKVEEIYTHPTGSSRA